MEEVCRVRYEGEGNRASMSSLGMPPSQHINWEDTVLFGEEKPECLEQWRPKCMYLIHHVQLLLIILTGY